MLQKSLKPERRFSRLKPTQAKVATKSVSGPITEVTNEFSARSCDPPNPYTKNAPTAQKFSDQRCKRTFATVSALRDMRSLDDCQSLWGQSGNGWIGCWFYPVASDPGCVKTVRGITVPGILGPVVMRRAKKHENLSSARHYDQIGFRFRTAKTQSGPHRRRVTLPTYRKRYSFLTELPVGRAEVLLFQLTAAFMPSAGIILI